MIALAAIAVLVLSGAGLTTKPASASAPNPTATQSQAPVPTAATASNTTFANSYYWYSTIDGSYNDYETVSYEIWEMEMYWGCQVDQNPLGGTLIEEAFPYMNPNYPVMVWLYGHFD